MFEVIELAYYEKKDLLLNKLSQCEWVAGRFLSEIVDDGSFHSLCGLNAKVLMLLDNDDIVSFCTYAFQDEIADKSMFPWIGFVYTYPKYRGNHYMGILFDHIYKLAKADGYEHLFVSTDSVGIYEKYGFIYYKNMFSIYGTDSKIYIKYLNEKA